jgi:hypothetical protein
MITKSLAAAAFVSLVSFPLAAQQPQIPTLQVCNKTQVSGEAEVKIQSRADAAHAGAFKVALSIKCDPAGYPAGSLRLSINMSDSTIQGTVSSEAFDQLTSTGKHSPTAYLSGRCKAENVPGCRFWMTLADNRRPDSHGTPDVVGFLIFNGSGQRVAYGTGPTSAGDITVAPTSN